MSTGHNDPVPPGPNPPGPGDQARKKAALAIAGLVIAAIPIVWAVNQWYFDNKDTNDYVEHASKACLEYQPMYQSLGREPDPEQVGYPAYAAYLQRLAAVGRAELKSWSDIPIPEKMAPDVKDAMFTARTALDNLEAAVPLAAQGSDRANTFLDSYNTNRAEALRKTARKNLEACPQFAR
ncbi:hypothetical protein [Streptomyces huiliensis]|uniref:hypothetical protein n=1 Tax=Streptomyces huiliensis TaxID=2876027 RepID=UPI001CBD1198|nr:hypothetical protein [Streptomyces huiliensis]MBZ4321041.1 hypothetical protein [Streptomyces huiliensis]